MSQLERITEERLAEWLAEWLAVALPDGCRRGEQMDELEDHLRCEIDALRRGGLDEDAAFRAATERLGSASALATEYARNRSLLTGLCTTEPPAEEATMGNPGRLPIRLAIYVLLSSAVWAGVMQVTSALLGDTETYSQVSDWLMAGWFFTTFMPLALTDLRSAARAECQCFRRMLRLRA